MPTSSTREDGKAPSNSLLDRLKPNGARKPAEPALSLDEDSFYIHGKKTRILSGSIHYFRVVPDYWADRLKKLKAMGLNTVDTYVSWNLHEPLPGEFDFSGLLNVQEFIKIAHSLELNVIVRPGPYICSEWDNGGLPAWLLHDPNMKIRSNYKPYQDAVERFFTKLFEILTPLQSSYGGPIIAFQVENEYAAYGPRNETGHDHMQYLANLMRSLGAVELFITSDGSNDMKPSSDMAPSNALLTVNFQNDPSEALNKLLLVQPNKPPLVMEYWTGWFDHWGRPHLERTISPSQLVVNIGTVLQMGGSFNLYMFHGGTNFGFMNGANIEGGEYRPDVTSYDYDAPLSEAGDITKKYTLLRELLKETVPHSIPNPLPDVPPNSVKESYGDVHLPLCLSLFQTLDYIPPPQESKKPMSMEYLSINKETGQAYGYVLYRTSISPLSTKLTITKLKDYGVALYDETPFAKLSSFASQTILLPQPSAKSSDVNLDLLVENSGRVNFGSQIGDRKGISGDVIVDDEFPKSWQIYSFEFKSSYIEHVMAGGLWSRSSPGTQIGPALFKGDFTISSTPQDTFIDMTGWTKGLVIINGVNLGRYWTVGPQRTLYVPAPLLRKGINKLLIFELHRPSSSFTVTFSKEPVLDSGGMK